MQSPRIIWISRDDPPHAFPDIESAFDVPDGLLAAGGDLSQDRILYAYRHGIFPWFNDGQPILWWSPDPRCVLKPGDLHISRRLKRSLRSSGCEVSFNAAFDAVICGCAEARPGQDGTWITADMRDAYCALHAEGWAHSIEVWSAGKLTGGLYGLAIDSVFFGESMFSRETNASKAAMIALGRILTENGFELLDCQVQSPHLLSLGASLMPRQVFSSVLRKSCARTLKFGKWPTERSRITDFMR